MTSPVASTSQPAQIPALEGPHKDAPAQKKSKDKKAKDATSSHPLEVRWNVSLPRARIHAIGSMLAEPQTGVLRSPYQNL